MHHGCRKQRGGPIWCWDAGSFGKLGGAAAKQLKKDQNMKKSFAYIIAAMVLVAPLVHAQERAAGGTLHTQMSWSALSSKIGVVDSKAVAANARLDQIEACGVKGMLYTPGQAGADPQGCKAVSTPDPATLDIQTHTETLCRQGGNFSVVASCPSGERLLGCGGGPGDQLEKGEYWVLMPDFKGNKCVGHAGNPWCNPDTYYGQTIVTAICYKP